MIRLVIVDDHEMVRAGIRGGLPADIEVVGEAADVQSAVSVISAQEPDVVLLDVHLPGGNAQAVLQQSSVDSRFLALSVSDASQDVIGVVRLGARGYVTKDITSADLATAIRQVAAGEAVFSPRLAGFVLDAFTGAAAKTDDELDRLTARERDVMRLIARGYTYREAAEELFLSVKTVETHMSAVLRKLQLSNRRELARWAKGRGLE
ncbi:MAG: response regulator transcription factor [Actinobacteria bacterium]|nr:response regulator transcription factor [Actinomycetota bacterium]HPE13352.1 response regulator transcription factor [Actinomycetota bacterium]HRV66363.1 response regulator transcription factor [Candidatus Nanopelagicales bacterium]